MDKTPTQWMTEPLRKYLHFYGRARRAEYWWFYLFSILVSLAAAIVDAVLGGIAIVGALVSLGLLLPSLGVGVRRLHDIGRSGWWLLLPLPPVLVFIVMLFSRIGGGAAIGGNFGIGAIVAGLLAVVAAIVLFIWACTAGTAGDNRFGHDPKAVTTR